MTRAELCTQLEVLRAAGLNFADCVDVFGVPRDTSPHACTAEGLYGREGYVEVDEMTVIAVPDEPCGGVYVMAWLWVDDSELK